MLELQAALQLLLSAYMLSRLRVLQGCPQLTEVHLPDVKSQQVSL
jgi:hypothetical protein